MQRRGLGKVQHIQTRCLWIQERIGEGHAKIVAVPGKVHDSDILTKAVSGAGIRLALGRLGFEVRDKSLLQKQTRKMQLSGVSASWQLGTAPLVRAVSLGPALLVRAGSEALHSVCVLTQWRLQRPRKRRSTTGRQKQKGQSTFLGTGRHCALVRARQANRGGLSDPCTAP